jgi:hypothetical protein
MQNLKREELNILASQAIAQMLTISSIKEKIS